MRLCALFVFPVFFSFKILLQQLWPLSLQNRKLIISDMLLLTLPIDCFAAFKRTMIFIRSIDFEAQVSEIFAISSFKRLIVNIKAVVLIFLRKFTSS